MNLKLINNCESYVFKRGFEYEVNFIFWGLVWFYRIEDILFFFFFIYENILSKMNVLV